MADGKGMEELRQDRNLTRKELAALALVDPMTIYRLERGLGRPRPRTVRRLAAALRISPAELRAALEQEGARLER